MTNYYNILEIPQTATITEIKSAFRKLSFRFHPDLNDDINAEENFKKVNEAYQILSDAMLRAIYDEKIKAHPFNASGRPVYSSFIKRKNPFKFYKNLIAIFTFIIIISLFAGISSSISSVREINEMKSNLSKRAGEYYKNNPNVKEKEVDLIIQRTNYIVELFRNMPEKKSLQSVNAIQKN